MKGSLCTLLDVTLDYWGTGITAYWSTVIIEDGTFTITNVGTGIRAWYNSLVYSDSSGSTIDANNYGLYVRQNSTVDFRSGTISNSQIGIYSFNSSFVDFGSGTFTGCTTNADPLVSSDGASPVVDNWGSITKV